MKEYMCIKIKGYTTEEIENIMSRLAKDRWQVICSCGKNNEMLILEREERLFK